MSDIQDLMARVIAFRDARDWKQFHNLKDMAISLVLESTEFMEHFQWKNPEEVAAHLRDNKEDVADELADVLYWVLIIANDLDIDLSEAVKGKLVKAEAKYPVEKSRGNHKKYTEL